MGKLQKSDIINKLHNLKPKLQNDGFNIIGLFGSYANDNATDNSDIDILYKIDDTEKYLQKYQGWDSILHIVETKEYLKNELNAEIDFVDQSTLSNISKDYILKELIYV
jgi:predicted nucleotidyltransferase